MREEKFIKFGFGCFALFVVLVIFGSCAASWAAHGKRETLMIQVGDKERVTESVGEEVSSRYLIYSTTETFEVTDSLIEGRFDSSDLYGSIQRDHCYHVEVYGWRVPVLSMYRNIVSAEEVPCER